MELSNYLVSWVVTYLGDLQPTCIGVIIYLLSTSRTSDRRECYRYHRFLCFFYPGNLEPKAKNRKDPHPKTKRSDLEITEKTGSDR